MEPKTGTGSGADAGGQRGHLSPAARGRRGLAPVASVRTAAEEREADQARGGATVAPGGKWIRWWGSDAHAVAIELPGHQVYVTMCARVQAVRDTALGLGDKTRCPTCSRRSEQPGLMPEVIGRLQEFAIKHRDARGREIEELAW